MKGRLALALAVLLIPRFAAAESSEEYALMAQQVWSAFECATLASHIGDNKTAERLFVLGYEQGKKFIRAIQEKRINKRDMSSKVPVIMMVLLQGPSDDFMLGRIFENAQGSALQNVLMTGDTPNSEENQKNFAKNEFRKRNCELLK